MNEEYNNLCLRCFEIFKSMSESINKFSASIDWEKVINSIEKLPYRVNNLQKKLLRQGWYIIDEITLNDLVCIEEDKQYNVDRIMEEYAEDNIDKLIDRIESQYPTRSPIIKDALNVHKLGIYNLSIPVLLTQVDGISFDMFNVSFFTKSNNEPKIKKAKEKYINKNIIYGEIFYELYLRPLDMITCFNMNSNQKDKIDKNLINRHSIIHGKDTNYGNKTNSCKCIMMLIYILDLRAKIKKYK